VEAEGGSAGGAAGADGSAAATSSRIDPASSASGASGAGSGGTGGSGGVKSVADERSELWAAHRQVNEATWRSSTGFLFRAEVTDVSVDSNVTLRWTYPSSSPGAESAWVGLWDANEFDWVGGEPRPRYIRYKALTSTKQEGTLRFTTKEWKGLHDGEYIFSIDTGSLPVGAGASTSYCVSQRLRIVGEAVAGLVGRAHGSPLPPTANQVALSRVARLAAASSTGPGGAGNTAESDDESEDEDTETQYLFAVPLLEYEMSEDKGNAEDVKKIYSMVDRLSYLDWGLRSEDEVSGKRERCQVSANLDTFDGCIVHDGAIWGEAAHGRGNGGRGAKTARTSEGYGEATQATAERLIQILSKLTHFVPAMGGWDGLWNLDADACFLDIGSGYGKVVIHAKLHTGCRSAVGVECVAKRVEISTLALQGLYGELDRGRLANDLLKGVSFEAIDATTVQQFAYSHIYIFDRVFSEVVDGR